MEQITSTITGGDTHVYLSYAFALTVGVAVLMIWVRRWIIRVEERRKSHVEHLKRFDAVRTDSPVDDPTEQSRERGMASIETRFAAIRRMVLPSIVFLWLFALLMPFLNRLPAAILSSLLGIVAVVVGIAARPFIENVIAGLVISFSQPIRIGDTVLVDGKYGTVEEISLTFTVIKIWDWRRYIVPNNRMLQKEIINYSIIDRFVWAYVEFWVSYEADLKEVGDMAKHAARRSKYFVPTEEPGFWVMEMGKEGVRCWVAGWADTPSSAWLLTHEIRTALSQALRERNIRCHAFQHDWRMPENAEPQQRSVGTAFPHTPHIPTASMSASSAKESGTDPSDDFLQNL